MRGDLIAGLNENDNADNVLVHNGISRVTSGLLLWAAVHWEVTLFPGVGNHITMLQNFSYVDPVIPPPVNAWVKDVTRDHLFSLINNFLMQEHLILAAFLRLSTMNSFVILMIYCF